MNSLKCHVSRENILKKYSPSEVLKKSDHQAILSDWTEVGNEIQKAIEKVGESIPDLGDDDERLEWLNNYFGEQYTSWSQISWAQMKWFLITLRLHLEINLLDHFTYESENKA